MRYQLRLGKDYNIVQQSSNSCQGKIYEFHTVYQRIERFNFFGRKQFVKVIKNAIVDLCWRRYAYFQLTLIQSSRSHRMCKVV